MSKVYFSSDWHIGHKNIHRFRSPDKGFPWRFKGEEGHREWLFGEARKILTKRDTLYLLGDIAFDEEALQAIRTTIPGRKVLVKGNHDVIKSPLEGRVYDQIQGAMRYKDTWLTHIPIHEQELRGRINLHGHVHFFTIPDKRYFNCCVENLVDIFNEPIVEYSRIKDYINYGIVRGEL